jgi:hypothetical protein
MSRLHALGSVLLLLLAWSAGAQGPGGNGAVTGHVRAAEGAPVPFASVTVRRMGDTLLVAASTTDSVGVFRITGVVPGSYRVQVRRLGFQIATRTDVAITGPADRVDLGSIQLEPIAVALQTVAVAATRAAVTVLPDRKRLRDRCHAGGRRGHGDRRAARRPRARGQPRGERHPTGIDARDLHQRSPPADAGRGARPLPPAAPGRAHRADRGHRESVGAIRGGRAGGIVNIVMKRGTGAGLSGSVALSAGTQNQQNGSGSLNFQTGRLSLFGSAAVSAFGNRSVSSDLRQNLNVQPATFIQQDARSHNSGGMGNATLAAELQVSPHGTFWAMSTPATPRRRSGQWSPTRTWISSGTSPSGTTA